MGKRKPQRTTVVEPPKGVPPSLVFLIPLALAVGLDFLLPLRLPAKQVLSPIGFALLLASLALMYAASGAQARAKTTATAWKHNEALVTDGPFRWSRNPAYLAFVLWFVAAGLLMASVWPFLFLIPTLVAFHYVVIVKEEAYLAARFGEAYDAYRAKVRRWL